MNKITLFPHQTKCVDAVENSWSKGNQNVLAVLPTGAGKSFILAEFAKRSAMMNEVCIVFAHKDILIGQLSDSLCAVGVRHTFIASQVAVRDITNSNLKEHGDSFYDESACVLVASVPTFAQRLKKGVLNHLLPLVRLWLGDENHHYLKKNIWGKCLKPLTNARGLGVTATPIRGDSCGLGRGKIIGQTEIEPIIENNIIIGYTEPEDIYDNDGLIDDMVVGATMGELIETGRLSPYKIFTKDVVDVTGVKVTAGGDYNQNELAKRTDKSDITGDAVEHYLELAAGQQTITFCVNISHSEHVAKEFNAAGIVSVAVSSKTPMGERQRIDKEFRAGRITNLVNCDLFGEGYDVKAVSVVIMLRKTMSYSLFKQQFGRALRVLDGKQYGILIDHVGNVPRHCTHGAPHDDPVWSLERRKKRKKADDDEEELPTGKICGECGFWEVPTKDPHVCTDCGHCETEEERVIATKDLQAKEGKLVEMDIDFIRQLMARREEVDRSPEEVRHRMQHAPAVARNGAVNSHTKRQYAQNELRAMIQKWCADMGKYNNWDKSITQRAFELEFKVNILKAQVLSERETLELTEKIKHEYI